MSEEKKKFHFPVSEEYGYVPMFGIALSLMFREYAPKTSKEMMRTGKKMFIIYSCISIAAMILGLVFNSFLGIIFTIILMLVIPRLALRESRSNMHRR